MPVNALLAEAGAMPCGIYAISAESSTARPVLQCATRPAPWSMNDSSEHALCPPAAPDPRSQAPSAPVRAYLDGLNPEQRQAAEALDGPLLVLAGAGTGKTRVLTTRLAHILATGRARPGEVLAVTFTNKAAREMIGRVERLMGRSAAGLWLGTFHAIAARILRRHAELAGLKPDFTILDTDDQVRLLKQLIRAENIDEKRWPARTLSVIIQRWKDRGLTADKVAGADGADYANGRAPKLYAAYQERLRTVNAADFGDLLLHNLTLFTRHGDVLADYQQRFTYLLVDEYQDTNVAQYLWLRLLAQTHHSICCVGDDDQSIYGWRGAEVGNILRFEQDFPGARVVRLERNYRSTGHILAAASALIAHNEGRLGKTLWTEGEQGEKVRITETWDGEEEARAVGDAIEALQRAGESLDTIAILVRAGFQTRAFEERFLTIGLPYRVLGGLRFYERQEIRDAVAYIRIVVRPDDDLAFERIVNLPKRGLGEVSLRPIHQLARSRGLSLCRAAERLIETDELKPRARSALSQLIERLRRWRSALAKTPHPDVVALMLDESGYTGMWQKDRSPAAPGRLENLKELVGALAEFEDLGAFLDHVSLVMDREGDESEAMASIMTLHGAKGLEFDTVFLPGWEEGLFPHQLALDQAGHAGLEEERRLAYVGLTRARRRAHILSAANRFRYNQWVSAIPSRFVGELAPESVERAEPTVMQAAPGGLYRGHGGGAHQRRLMAEHAGYRGRRTPPTIEAAPLPAGGKAGTQGYTAGELVFHLKFGYGRITSVDGDKLDVAFDKAGPKKIIDRFVQPADSV